MEASRRYFFETEILLELGYDSALAGLGEGEPLRIEMPSEIALRTDADTVL
jgi:hypothetical protein